MNEKNWIKRGNRKRQSESSSVVFFETQDKYRYEEFYDYLYLAQKQGKITKAWNYDMHKGLQEIQFEVAQGIPQPVLVPVKQPGANSEDADFLSGLMGGSSTRITQPETALPLAEFYLTTFKQSILMCTNLIQHQALNLAINCWATDPTLLYKADSAVYIFGYANDLLPTSTRDLCAVVDVPLSLEEERKKLLDIAAKKFRIEPNPQIVKATAGLTLHQVESVLCESIFEFGEFKLEAITSQKMDAIRKSGLLDPVEVDHGWESVAGLDSTIEHITNSFIDPLTNKRELAEILGLDPPRGLLFFGPPGTGKTWICEALAYELKMPFFKMVNVGSRWYGESESNIRKLQKVAEENAPCILFIDEIDRWGKRGSATEHEVTRKLFAKFLEWLGDRKRKTIIVGTTNVPRQLDDAFIRIGRFSDIIPILYPDTTGRAAILDVHLNVLRNVPQTKDIDLTLIAEKTAYFSGAELEGLVQFAQREALREGVTKVSMKHFETMITNFTIDMLERKKQMQKYLDEAKKLSTDQRFIKTLDMDVQKETSKFDKVSKRLQEGQL